jgi:pentose-5-phosphate-3-epimerase
MIFLPSLLEYSKESLEKKLQKVEANLTEFIKLQCGQKPSNSIDKIPIHFHLDFVLEQFAKDRSVMKSSDLATVFSVLEEFFKNRKLILSIHLMGTIEDLFDTYKFFLNYSVNQNWDYEIYVPENYTNQFEFIARTEENMKIGIWYDLEEWESRFGIKNKKLKIKNSEVDQIKDYLLMTVLAGKSGQKLTDKVESKVLEIVKNNPELNFIVDGGWSLQFREKYRTEESDYNNLFVVSYTSFWKEFDKALKEN